MFKKFLATGLAIVAMVGAVNATTLSGVFTGIAINATNLTAAQSQATAANFNAAGAMAGSNQMNFTYTGALNFGTFDGTDSTTIGDFLASGGGSLSGLSIGAAGVLGLQNSMPDIGAGTATSTFYLFQMMLPDAITRLSITHDDGVNVFDDFSFIGGFNGPNGVRTTDVMGFDGGNLSFIYVSTNGDPSVFRVAAVPLPAGVILLMGGLGGLAALRRRQRAA